eukprot:TRINITY_DN11414_c0_g1_i4.p1 TRINITY_DN11414_c0_g1~~TRINITY_DN11414_c0_g1_i4.p1  ORF type:complete len:209 (-),score=34.43 TRINITY_DN11414_c0_g1_i4:149-775(-)
MILIEIASTDGASLNSVETQYSSPIKRFAKMREDGLAREHLKGWAVLQETCVLVDVISTLLTQLIESDAGREVQPEKELKLFNSRVAPNITVKDYIQRFTKHSKCSPESLLTTLILLDRVMSQRDLVLTYKNIHRLFLVGLLISAKFHDDIPVSNQLFAKLGGVRLSELNSLEVVFLDLLSFNVAVEDSVFDEYADEFSRLAKTTQVA